MSYILDALRRADAQRERGGVPGIHAQQLPLGGLPEADRAPASRKLLWACAGLALLLLASLVWQWLAGHDGADSPAAPRAAQGTVTPPPAVPGPAEPAPARPAPLPAAEASAPTVTAAPATPPRKPPAVAAATQTAAAKVKAPVAGVSSAASAAGAASSAAAPRVMARSELPDEVQRNLPVLTVGGASYSQNPVNRMLIVNGQIFREGDLLAPDVALEQIRLKEAVIATKGYRYRIDY